MRLPSLAFRQVRRYVSISVRHFLKIEANSSFVLVVCALAALIITNTGWQDEYALLLDWPMHLHLGPIALEKTALLWVNDGLMAIFFFLIGLELKREFVTGHLSNVRDAALPAFAALGGMLVPGLVFAAFNYDDPDALRGWAIPTATDIAFSLGVLMMLGARVPTGLKVFLLALAILDDLGAVLIIALYYSSGLHLVNLLYAAGCFAALLALNRLRVLPAAPYMLLGLVMWYFVLKSGVHATIAGVALAFAIPACRLPGHPHSPLIILQHRMHPWVAFLILPLFAFFNAGVYLLDVSPHSLTDSLTLGILFGLFLGKPIGICLFTALAVALGLGSLPRNVRWPAFAGMSALCGMGFTMSLFVSTLAHGPMPELLVGDKIGIVLGSVLSAAVGYLLLRLYLPPAHFPGPSSPPSSA